MHVEARFTGTDRFKVLSELGTGGMGVVYEAIDRDRDARVAVKTLRTQDAKFLLRFKREFRAIRDLRHPNLVELGELFEQGGVWFFTMELVAGVDILSYIEARPGSGHRFHEGRLRSALAGLGAGLAALHRAGKVHCDIKPSNVMVTPSGRVVVLDFSVVAELDQDSEGRVVAGSPLYMAPEQIRGVNVGPSADWYAVGVLLFQAMTGDVPLRGRDTPHTFMRKVHERAPHPGTLVAGLPEDLSSLCYRLLAPSASERPSEAEILAQLGVPEERVSTPGHDSSMRLGRRLFVGRKDALARLRTAYRDSRDGGRVSVFVEGESGVGKTALVEHFVEELRHEHGALVFRGQCHEREFVPYNAFDGMVDGMARYLRNRPWHASFTGADEILAPLLHVFPVLRGLSGFGLAEGTMPGDVRRLAFFGFRQLLGWIAEQGALVLVIDDIHWADADSLTLLGELMSARGGPSFLLLCTARSLDDGRPCPAIRTAAGEAGREVRRIELEGLRDDEAEELAHRLFELLPGGLVGDIATVLSETGGHPMFMDELVRHMARQGVPHGGGRRAQLDDALRDRIASLELQAQRVLELVVVAGVPLSRDIIAEAAALPADTFSHWLAILRGANLLRLSGPDQEAEIATYHSRVREAVYAHLPSERRRALHGELAAALEAKTTEPVLLATHFHRAGDMKKAARYALDGARKAVESLAFDQAAELYKLALSAMPASQRGRDEQRELLTELGTALQNAGRTRESAAAFTDAAELAGTTEALDLRRRAAELLLEGGYLEQGVGAIDEVLAQAGFKMHRSGKWLLPRVAWGLYRLYRRKLVWRTPAAEAMDTPEFARKATKVDVCWSAGAGLSLVDTVRGIYFASRGTELSLRLGEPNRIARGLGTSSVAASALGKPAIARRMLEAAERAAREHGGNEALFYAELARFVYSFFYEQKWRACVTEGRELERIWNAAGKGHTYEMDFVILFCSWSQSMLGDVNELARFVDMFVSDAKRLSNRLLEVSLRASHSLVYLGVDDPERARADVRDAIDSWLPGRDDLHLPDIWALLNLCDICLYCGDPFATSEYDSGFRRLERSLLHNTRWSLWQHEFLAGRIALARAALHRSRGQRGGLRRELGDAQRMARNLAGREAPVTRLWGALLSACAAHVQGDDERAARELEAVHQGFVDAETMLHAQASAYRLGQILGGSEGESMQADARARIAMLGVARPERIVAMLAPGWDD
jgi:eukaryotic-like serine/threonine-protein kinase